MVKYFCDKCGREIPVDGRFNVNGMKGVATYDEWTDEKLTLNKTLCEDCYDEVLAVIGGDDSE